MNAPAAQQPRPAGRVPLSILDLVPVWQGGSIKDAFEASLRLAEAADRWGYARLWYAEHHNALPFASPATSLLIARAAEHTTRIRLGAGGVMLPNHSPLLVAEYYGTLAEMHPGRIDLGLGRAPGTDPLTARALRRGAETTESFVPDILELHRYLAASDDPAPADPASADPASAGPGSEQPRRVRAYPGAGTAVPLWMLGSSLAGAQVAAVLGLPFVFASHFAPQLRHEAIARYRDDFRSDLETAWLEAPWVMAGVNVLVAPTDQEAAHLFTTHQQMAAMIRTGHRAPLAPPVADLDAALGGQLAAYIRRGMPVSAVGSPATVVRRLEEIVAELALDEVIITTYTHDPALRVRSLELLAQAWASPGSGDPT